jgi:hypothetical protein
MVYSHFCASQLINKNPETTENKIAFLAPLIAKITLYYSKHVIKC